MKKNYFLVILILSVASFYGQEESNETFREFRVGINIGPNYNSFRNSSFGDKYDANFNFLSGISIEYFINENTSILTSFNYEVKSGKSSYKLSGLQTNNGNLEIDEKTKFDYLNIPILVRYHINSGDSFFIDGGFFYNHLLNVKNEAIDRQSGENYSELDFNSLFKKTDFGLSLGVGLRYNLNDKNDIMVELRNDYGLSEIGNHYFRSLSGTKTNSLKLIVNWNFSL